ncbi:MAG: Glu-tRNA(Gln) amidotransferase subunit GatD [Candidatus Hodarchaeota archaeon]
MLEEKYAGYKGLALNWMIEKDLEIWDEIKILKDDTQLTGVILPRNELANPNFISLKLPTGYNVGFNPINIQKMKKIRRIKGEYRVPTIDIVQNNNLPFVPVIGCGGTIVSRLDYRTGGTIPALSLEELISLFPEIANLARIETKLLFNLFSENINFNHYIEILNVIETVIKKENPKGIVLTHGTDTLAYTAAALSFSINNPPCPIVLTGSQRSSDRPSSDSFFNLYNSILYSTSPIARNEVVVIMHEESSDISFTIHKGTRLRKMHSSRRDAFKTIGEAPLGKIIEGKVHYYGEKPLLDLKSQPKRKAFSISKKFEDKIGLIYHYPGIKPGIIEYHMQAGYKGIIIAGTGLGHVSSDLIPILKKGINDGLIVVMTTQCLHGFTGMSVYESGRKLLKIGIIPVLNILPETAFIKLAYLFGNYQNTDKIKELMIKNLKGEIISRERFSAFH